jgi:hypothetical protein
MGAGGFHGRVRDGIGCRPPAKATRSSNPPCIEYQGDAGSGEMLYAATQTNDLGMISMHGVVSSRLGD